MPRIAEARTAAEPSSPGQVERRERILRAAAHIGAEKGLERVQMHEVAKDAGVAIGTLYRYFPSKTHLFTAVMADRVERFDERTRSGPDPAAEPAEAVAQVLVSASRELLRKPTLAVAMLQSSNTANAATVPDVGRIDRTFRDLILRVLGIRTPTAQDMALVRLLLQLWYGVLQASLNARVSIVDAESDIRMGAKLLLAPRSNSCDRN